MDALTVAFGFVSPPATYKSGLPRPPGDARLPDAPLRACGHNSAGSGIGQRRRGAGPEGSPQGWGEQRLAPAALGRPWPSRHSRILRSTRRAIRGPNASFAEPRGFSPPRGDAEPPTETTQGPKGRERELASAHPGQGCSAQCPRRTLLRQWAHGRRKKPCPLSAMPPSPKELRHGSRRLVRAPSEATAAARAAAKRPSPRGETVLVTFAKTPFRRERNGTRLSAPEGPKPGRASVKSHPFGGGRSCASLRPRHLCIPAHHGGRSAPRSFISLTCSGLPQEIST
jgi:hypothetical protein